METKSILLEIGRLPVEEKMLIVEKTIKAIREKELREKMTGAVAELKEEYRKNSELTAFTDIDFENFYETR